MKQCSQDAQFHLRWLNIPCGGPNPVCATKSDGAGVCSTSTNRSPECAGRPDASFCATASEPHFCQDGFLIVSNCDEPDTQAKECVFSKQMQSAICAISSIPDPRCGGAQGAVCDGSTYVDCVGGYVQRIQACQSCSYSQLNRAECH
jgi:hypothetical protein